MKGENPIGTKIKSRKNRFQAYFVLFIMIVLFAVFSILRPQHFFTWSNFQTILEQTSVVLVAGMGMTYVIMTGGIDLSAGSVLGLSGGIFAIAMRENVPVWLALTIGILVGCLCGLINGVILAKLKIPAFITTLGMMMAARGLLRIISKGQTVLISNNTLRLFGSGSSFIFPNVFWIFLVVGVIYYIVFNYTPFGRYVRAVGGGEEVTRYSGISVSKIKIAVMVLGGLSFGIAGVLSVLRMGSSTPTLGNSFEMDVISSVVLGGTTLSGGVGTIQGTILGALVMGILNNGFNILGVSADVQMILKGVILVLAVVISLDRKKLNVIK